ncbi:MAG: FAD-dependent oxidoreductase [Pseudomonadales bacterium]|nr:FAD-dependent oxidoreductase [Pseudomonadales bacterium]
MESYRHLGSPIRIGAMTLRNRMVMSAMTTNYGSADFEVTERLIRYHEARARGGVGLITVEMCSVDVAQRYQPQSLSLGEDRFIAGHRELVGRVHAHGARIQPQISHPGPESMTDPVGPSVNVNAGTGWPSRVLEREEIERIVTQYGDAAVRAREAGYDGMELHAAHGYMLLGSFLCPVRNRREDEYTGATVEGRTRLLLRVIRHIKERAGADFPITLRISGNEDAFDGRMLNDTQLIAPLLEEAGIDAFQVSGGVSHDKIVAQIVCGPHYRDGYNVAVAAAVRKVVSVPVMVVGRIHDPAFAERIIADGDADMVAMARPLLADPELPVKVLSARTNEIRRCLSCQNCIDSMLIAPFDANMNCAVNAQSGREAALAITPAAVRKRVLVVGGGPAGMEAARVAALRGHEVRLVERGGRLGGALFYASVVHEDNQRLLDYLLGEMSRLPVKVELGRALAPGQCTDADAVVVATGAKVLRPVIAGSESAHVYDASAVRGWFSGTLPAEEAARWPALLRLLGRHVMPRAQPWLRPGHVRTASRHFLPLGRRVCVIGSDLPALELADFVAHRGRRVTLIAEEQWFAQDVGPKRRQEQLSALDRLGVEVLGGVRLTGIDADAVRFEYAGRAGSVPVDNVIIAGNPAADSSFADALAGHVAQVHAIGDCTGPGLLRKALEDGLRAGIAL